VVNVAHYSYNRSARYKIFRVIGRIKVGFFILRAGWHEHAQEAKGVGGFLVLRDVSLELGALVDAQGAGTDPATATRTATLVIATIRGLLLDLLATGDRARVQDAAETFLASLGHNASSGTMHPTAPAAQSEDDVT